ncbi:MAG: Lrp/AsnC family transcriptional regulator [Deltaproteobacteria bacterium]|jgi:DNA-binding Lrp family transcriptional regulator|nr:Lrp/AsnC family transcriptional regulator [Deltaproteobacteria bacterium]
MADPASGPGPGSPAPLSLEEKKLIHLLSQDLSISERPYLELAQKIGLTEAKVLAMIEDFQKRGLIRRLGAVVVHQRSGFKFNAMAVWQVPPDDLDRAGRALAGLAWVSHCYHRSPAEGWPYNLYTMIHARSREELTAQIEAMTVLAGAVRRKVLESVRELKKTSLEYFPEAAV